MNLIAGLLITAAVGLLLWGLATMWKNRDWWK